MQTNALEYLERTVESYPTRAAVVDSSGSYTFEQLHRAALLLSGAIVAKADVFGLPVAVYLPKCKEAVVVFAAVLYSGNCYAPLDVKSPVSRTAAVLGRLQPSCVVTRRNYLEAIKAAGVPDDQIVLVDGSGGDCGAGITNRFRRCIDTDPIYIIHTSGSTGLPKGVTVTHRGVIDYIDWALDTYRIDASARIGNQAPFYFDNSTLDLYLSFATGATLVLIPEELFLFPIRLVEYVRDQGISFVFWVPSVLVNVANVGVLAQVPLPALTHILFAGEVMPTRQLKYWRQRCPKALFSNLYGPTEITVDCTYFHVERDFADDEPLPIGFPCRNSDVLILTEQNRLAAPGERGELCVRGSSLALGYWNDPERTAAVFTQNPLHEHYPDRIYRTGDLVYRNERGEIIFIGRTDFQIKHMGYRIELGDIETAVMAIPEIRNACVIYDAPNIRIVLFFESDRTLDAAFVRRALTDRLPRYMIPSVCTQLDQLPLNPSGKIDRRLLGDVLKRQAHAASGDSERGAPANR